MISVPVGAGGAFNAGAPTVVVNGPYGYADLLPQWVYDVSPDGQRFVLIKETGSEGQASATQQIIVVQNWFEELRRRVPGN